MKTNSLILLMLCSFPVFVSAQDSIPNRGFESWHIDSLPPEPVTWRTTNPLAYEANGAANVTKSTDMVSGNLAIRLENVSDQQGGVIYGAALIGGLPDVQNFSFPGGHVLNGKPDSLVFYYKCTMSGSDSALIGVILKSQGQPIAFDITYVGGTQNTYVRVSKPISYLIPFILPDTAWVGMIAGDIANPQIGSVLWVDDIQFIRNSAPLTTNIPNGGFENWVVNSFDQPDNWGTTNALTGFSGYYSVTRSTDKHSGDFSLKIETMTANDGFDTIGVASTGKIWSNGDINGGFPYTSHPHFLNFWYKYSSPAPSFDSAMAGVYFIKNGVTLDSTLATFGPSASWQFKEIFLGFDTAFQDPDSLNLMFASSGFFADRSNIKIGSILLVDDVQLREYALSAPSPADVIQSHLVYPNPANAEVQFNFHLRAAGDINISIFDVTGRKVDEYSPGRHAAGSSTFTADVTGYDPAVYIYRLSSGGQVISGRFTIAR
jgi:hypothetical protein